MKFSKAEAWCGEGRPELKKRVVGATTSQSSAHYSKYRFQDQALELELTNLGSSAKFPAPHFDELEGIEVPCNITSDAARC